MSFPNIPDVTPKIDLAREDVINLLLASIAFEELGLSHIINSEAEKIQYILGTLPGQPTPPQATIDDLLKVDQAVQQVLRKVIDKEMLLGFKMEDILTISSTSSTSSSSTTSTSSSSTSSTSTESTTSSSSTSSTSTESTTSSSSTSSTSTESTTSSSSTSSTSTESTTSSSSTSSTSTESTTSSSSTSSTSTESTTSSSSTSSTSTESTTSSSTTTSSESTTSSTTTVPVELGSAWAVGTPFGTGNTQYVTFETTDTEKTVVLGLGNTNIPVGTVKIVRFNNDLFVTYTTDSPYVMQTVQLDVKDTIPTNSIPGSYPFKFSVDNPSEYFTTFTFDVDITLFAGETIYVAAHANIYS